MKNGFIGLILGSILVSGSIAHSALIEGHFYALTCGQNEISAQVLPIDRNIDGQGQVTQVCHGHLLENGTPVETIRYSIVLDDHSTHMIDFRVVERSLLTGRLNNHRGQARQMVIAAENPEFGRLQFQGLSFDGRFYTLQVVNNNPDLSFLNIQVSQMVDMVNIASMPIEGSYTLRTSGDIDVWNPRK